MKPYDGKAFSDDLAHQIESGNTAFISQWAYKVRLQRLPDVVPKVSEWLLQLGAMDIATELAMSEQELWSIVAAAREL